jgi:hypothetical protein
VTGIISAYENQSITVAIDGTEEFASIVTDGTETVVNGFALDWPVSTDESYHNGERAPIMKTFRLPGEERNWSTSLRLIHIKK